MRFASKNRKKAPFLFILAQKVIKITAFLRLKSLFLSILKIFGTAREVKYFDLMHNNQSAFCRSPPFVKQ